MAHPSGAFFTRPEQERCQAQGPHCLSTPEMRIYCSTEGRSLRSCRPCYLGWQERAKTGGLTLRCPLCADIVLTIPSQPKPQPEAIPLSGPAADAINAAMHAEGLTIDVRKRVLVRLALAAGWLEYVYNTAPEVGRS